MSGEAENKMEVDGESQEALKVARDPSPESFKDKYRTLKDRLKYLVYVSVCRALRSANRCSSMCMQGAVCYLCVCLLSGA